MQLGHCRMAFCKSGGLGFQMHRWYIELHKRVATHSLSKLVRRTASDPDASFVRVRGSSLGV